jgi:DNA-binding Lrp family transcriptional regulator
MTTDTWVSSHRMYLLVQTDPGRAPDAQAFLVGMPGIREVVTTSGPFDLIVAADAPDTARLEHVVAQCRRTPGLARLSRCHLVGG